MLTFANKEIAEIVIWLTLVISLLYYKKTRLALFSVLKVLINPYLLVPLTILFLYIGIIINELYKLGLWNLGMTYILGVWIITVAISFFLNANEISSTKQLIEKIKQATTDSLTIGLLVFIIDLNQLSILTYLLLIPMLTFLNLLHIVAKSKKEFSSIARFTGSILSAIGFYLLIQSATVISSEPTQYLTISNFTVYLLPIILTLALIPYIYLLMLFIAYDDIFRFINYFMAKNNTKLARLFRQKVLFLCKLNLDKAIKVSKAKHEFRQMRHESDIDIFIKRLNLMKTRL